MRDIVSRISRMEEDIRRLKLRPTGGSDPVEDWQSLEPYLAPGWETGGTLGESWFHARFYKDRDRVYFAGMIGYYGAGGAFGHDAGAPISGMPAGYRVSMLTNVPFFVDPDNVFTGDNTWDKFWMGEFLPLGDGDVGPGGVKFDPRDDFLSADEPGYPPYATEFVLDSISYRVS